MYSYQVYSLIKPKGQNIYYVFCVGRDVLLFQSTSFDQDAFTRHAQCAGKHFQWDQSDRHTRNEIASESGRNESLVSCIRKRRCRVKGIERSTFPSIELPRMIVKLPERLRLATKLASVGRRCLVEKSRFDIR